MKKILFLFAFAITLFSAQAQEKKPVQITGVIMTAEETAQYVPYAHVLIKGRNQGTITDGEGFFSFVAVPGDTIQFSTIGFKKEYLRVPDTLEQTEYLVRIIMKRDTTMLQEVTLYPWPTGERFKEEFMAMRVPNTANDLAMRNLAIEELKARAAQMGYGPEEIQDYVISAQNADIYNFGRYQGFQNGGTAILGSLTNPFAWAEFFEAIKRGDFKKK